MVCHQKFRQSHQPILDLKAKRCAASGQGDKIGRIFAYWAFVFFGQCFENYVSSSHL
jgi:hypothetical protein